MLIWIMEMPTFCTNFLVFFYLYGDIWTIFSFSTFAIWL